MARPPEGPNLADRLEGDEDAKHRLKVILETISGQRTIADAANEIGVGAARFHELRQHVLQAALVALAPKPAGRPRLEKEPEPDPRVAELESQLRELTLEVNAAKVREQIARTMPHLLQSSHEDDAGSEQKKAAKPRKPSKVLDRLRRDREKRNRG